MVAYCISITGTPDRKNNLKSGNVLNTLKAMNAGQCCSEYYKWD
jgi:hypothetical protein